MPTKVVGTTYNIKNFLMHIHSEPSFLLIYIQNHIFLHFKQFYSIYIYNPLNIRIYVSLQTHACFIYMYSTNKSMYSMLKILYRYFLILHCMIGGGGLCLYILKKQQGDVNQENLDMKYNILEIHVN